MKNPLAYYVTLAKRWAWMIVLGMVICSGATYAVSKNMQPVYQASITFFLNLGSQSPYDNAVGSEQAASTYAQLLTSSAVLDRVAKQRGLTSQQLRAMITVKPQTNTQLIELDVENSNPHLATQLANDISTSFAHYVNTGPTSATISPLPVQQPTAPIRPTTLRNTAIGALVGLALALALIVIFEWMDDRLKSPEEVEELLGAEILAVIPRLSRKQRAMKAEEMPAYAEAYRILSANLNIAHLVTPFKLVMITSSLASEGKSTVAINLASFLVMAGKRVLLVDANLRSPALDAYFQLDGFPEHASASSETWTHIEEKLDTQQTETDIPNLHVLTAAVLGSDFTNLLQSPWVNQLLEHFEKASFDYIIFDTPPLLPVADAQLLAAYVDAIVLVVDAAKTPRKVLQRTKQMLNRTRTMIPGVVINKSPWQESNEIRQYFKDVQPFRTSIDKSIPMPPRTKVPMIKPPDTPPVDSVVDPDVTITVRSLQRTRDKKS